MQVFSHASVILTVGKNFYSLDKELLNACTASGIQQGIVNIFVKHTSASLILMENCDVAARDDLMQFFDRLVPEDTSYFTHTYEGKDDMPSHIRSVLTANSQTIPIVNGELALGTWQGLFLFEHRRESHRRHIVYQIVGSK